MKRCLVMLSFLALSGCGSYPPGTDDLGRTLQFNGEKVLNAVRSYMDDTSRQPSNLQQLVPKYLDALPAEPNIAYDAKNSIMAFTYIQGGPGGMSVTCHAIIGQVQWVCV